MGGGLSLFVDVNAFAHDAPVGVEVSVFAEKDVPQVAFLVGVAEVRRVFQVPDLQVQQQPGGVFLSAPAFRQLAVGQAPAHVFQAPQGVEVELFHVVQPAAVGLGKDEATVQPLHTCFFVGVHQLVPVGLADVFVPIEGKHGPLYVVQGDGAAVDGQLFGIAIIILHRSVLFSGGTSLS